MRTLRLFLLLMLLAACSDPSGPSARSLRVHASVIQAPRTNEPNVAVTVQNRGSRPVRVFSCGERVRVTVERREPSGWENYTSGYCIASVISEPLQLAAGETLSTAVYAGEPGVDRVRVEGWYMDNPESARSVASDPVTVP